MLGDANLWNDFGFSLYTVPFVYYIIITSDEWIKSEMEVSTNWYVTIEHWRSNLIRVIFVDYQTSKLQYNY